MTRVLGSLALLLLWAGFAQGATAIIVDGDTLILGDTRYRINGIDAPEAGQNCLSERGKKWACGDAATNALYDLTVGRDVRCEELATDGYGRTIARCYVGRTDLAQEMVRLGMAWAFLKFSDEYEADQNTAKRAKRGIWRGESQPAWDFRADRWNVAAQKAPNGCPIKGNISQNGRIYHPPWSPWYGRTKINTAKGERWFCDEAEAVKAGWRAPRYR